LLLLLLPKLAVQLLLLLTHGAGKLACADTPAQPAAAAAVDA
jgi:hypothetical protein